MTLKRIYDEIWDSSKTDILKNNIEVDNNLLNLRSDKRLGLTVIIPVRGGCSDNFMKIINILKAEEPNQYFYPPSDIHVTIVNFAMCSEDFVFDQKKIDVYREVLEKTTAKFSKFNINFQGLTASRGAVMVRGFFDETLEHLREDIRDGKKIEIKERYKPRTAHSTIMRFRSALKNPEKFVERIEELRNREFGTMEVTKILFVLHDWYNRKEKTRILGEYELR